MKLLLDTNILVKLCHPKGTDVQQWLQSLLSRGADSPEILVSVLADYELRAALGRRGAKGSLKRLDTLARAITHVPVTPEVGRRAAEISACMSPEDRGRFSDADVLLAAQAELEGATLVTTDRTLHTLPGVTAKDWTEIKPEGSTVSR